MHKCQVKHKNIRGTSKWVACEFLHQWRGEPAPTARIVSQEIERVHGVKCPKSKLIRAKTIGSEIVGTNLAVS